MIHIDNLTLYLVRHGQTFFNTTLQVQGHCDSLLTDEGRRQAILTGKALSNIPFAGSYCGDLGRHRATTHLILAENRHEKPSLIEDTGLREWGFGGYEGRDDELMWKPVFEKFGFDFDIEFTNYEKLNNLLSDRGISEEIAKNDPMGLVEHYDDILERVDTAFNRILTDMSGSKNKNVLIVTSGGLISTILQQLIPDYYSGEPINNCSITTLLYSKNKYKQLSLAQAKHLQPTQAEGNDGMKGDI